MSHSFIRRLKTLRLQVLPNQNIGAGGPALDGDAAVDLMGLVRKVAEDNPRPRIVVLGSGEGARTSTFLLSALRGARILAVDVGLDVSDLQVRLAARGRSDVVIVDRTVDGTRHADLFDRVFGNRREQKILLAYSRSGAWAASRLPTRSHRPRGAWLDEVLGATGPTSEGR